MSDLTPCSVTLALRITSLCTARPPWPMLHGRSIPWRTAPGSGRAAASGRPLRYRQAPSPRRRKPASRALAPPVGFKYSAMGPDLQLGKQPSGWLCGRFVLADQAAEDRVASDPVEWDRERDHVLVAVGCLKAKRAVGPSAVVVGGVLLQHHAQMSLPGDEHPVGAFGPGGENPALRKGIRSRALRWDLEWLDAFADEHSVGRGCEVRPVVAERELDVRESLAEAHGEVAGLLHRPLAGRMPGDAAEVHPAGAVLGEHQHMQPSQQDGACVQEAGGEDPGGLGWQGPPPG